MKNVIDVGESDPLNSSREAFTRRLRSSARDPGRTGTGSLTSETLASVGLRHSGFDAFLNYATVPNNAPTAAVASMARVPQSNTRTVPVTAFAPPTREANAPRKARHTREPPLTPGTM